MDIIGEIFTLVMDSLIIFGIMQELYKIRAAIISLENTPYFDINHEMLSDKSAGVNKTIPCVIIRGTVLGLVPNIPSSFHPHLQGVIRKHMISEQILTRVAAGFWSCKTQPMHVIQKVVPFAIIHGDYAIEVVDALAAHILDVDVVWEKYIPYRDTMLDYVWAFVSGTRLQGYRMTEELLREGTLVTGIGDIRNINGKLRLQATSSGGTLFITTLTKSHLIQKLKDSENSILRVGYILGLIGLVICGTIVRKYFESRKQLVRHLRLRQQLQQSRNERNLEQGMLSEDQLCIVCAQNIREIILLPCGHVSLCEDCSGHINELCPICREPIEEKRVAFI